MEVRGDKGLQQRQAAVEVRLGLPRADEVDMVVGDNGTRKSPSDVTGKTGTLQMIVIELPGDPRGKGRPRSRVAWTKDDKPFVAVYTDAETRKYETALAWAAKAAMRSTSPLSGPVVVWIDSYFPVPQSWSRPKRDAALAGVIRPIGKPDFDNVAKIACDALKGIAWTDDSRIVEAHVVKKYSERPALKIRIEELEAWTDEAAEQRRQLSLV